MTELQERKQLSRVLMHGKLFALLSGNGSNARMYAVEESRGYTTDYRPKNFFYLLVLSKEGHPKSAHKIGDRRPKDVMKHWKSANININVKDEKLFNEWKER